MWGADRPYGLESLWTGTGLIRIAKANANAMAFFVFKAFPGIPGWLTYQEAGLLKASPSVKGCRRYRLAANGQ
jgi:hypothetical protein